MGGDHEARQGLRQLMQAVLGGGSLSWGKAQPEYRQRLYVQRRQKRLDPDGHTIRKGFTPEDTEQTGDRQIVADF